MTRPSPTVSLTQVCRYLMNYLEWMRHRPEVVEFADEVADLVKRAKRTVDRPAPRWWAGVCDHASDVALIDHCFGYPLVRCVEVLYMTVGRDSVTCRGCGTEHTVGSRRTWLLQEMRKEYLPLQTIVTALAWLDRPVSFGRLRTWAWRKKLGELGEDAAGRTLYSAGDVLRLMDAENAQVQRTA